MKNNQGGKRTQKPLSWYLMENEKEESQSPSPAFSENRKSSVDSLASSISSIKLSNEAREEAARKRGKKGGRQRVKKVSVNFTIAGSEAKERQVPVPVEEKVPTTQSQLIAAAVAKDRKEDYWYYDPISDGFYYENNGSRGWKKRNPKVHGPPPSQKKMPEPEKVEQKLPQAPGPKPFAPMGAPNAVKYYDPASDGYYFEMASVDGWRRRQPVPVNYPGAMNMMHQDGRKQMQPPPMSAHHFPPLGTVSQTATPTPSPAGSFMPQSTLLTHTQLEDMIVRHPSLVSMNKARIGAMASEEVPASNSSTTSSSISDEITTPPPQNHQNSIFMQHFRRNGALQQSSSATVLNNQQSSTFAVGSNPDNELYDFYWSDTEKPSSISSFDDSEIQNRAVGARRPETLNFSSMERQQQQAAQKAWWETNTVEQTHRFDVDRFIADLPFDREEKAIRDLCALNTPIGERRRDTDDSTIYTPLKENDWLNPMLRTPIKTDKVDYEKIWRTPCA